MSAPDHDRLDVDLDRESPAGGSPRGERLGRGIRDPAARALQAVVEAGRELHEPGAASTVAQAPGDLGRWSFPALVAAAGEGLAERDRALLELSAAGPCSGGQLAEAVGVPPGQIYMVLNRMRRRAWRSMAAVVLVDGDEAPTCPGLDDVLGQCEDGFTPLVRKRVARHLDRCLSCRVEARRRIAASLGDGGSSAP